MIAYVYRIYSGIVGNSGVDRTANICELDNIALRYFPEFTGYRATGYWNGKPELSYVLEFIQPKPEDEKIEKLAADLKHHNNQYCVLVTKGTTTREMI